MTPIKALLMAAIISISIGQLGQRTMTSWGEAKQQAADALDVAMGQVLREAESYVKANEFAGGVSPGGGKVGVRSGELRRDITHERTGPLKGVVGTTERTAPYAKAILGPNPTTIRPVNAKHLWVPIAENLTKSGVSRFTPRALFETFGDRVRIFNTKAGNTVVFVEDARNEDGSKARYQRDTKAGRQAGDLKGKLMFVLKDEVRIEGTDALARGVNAMTDRARAIFEQALRGALP